MRKEIYILIGLVALFSLALVSTTEAVSSVTATPSTTFGSQVANYTISFTTASSTEINSKIVVTFPSGFNVVNAASSTVTGFDGTISTVSALGQAVTLTRADGSITGAGTGRGVTITNIVNPTTGGSLTLTVVIYGADGTTLLDDEGTSTAFTIISCCAAPSFYSDTTPPTSKIISPTEGLSISAGKKYVIEGAGTDVGGSTVERVEVSLDGGQSWSIAQSSAAGNSFSWQYVWQNPTGGEYVIQVRATDSRGNRESPSAGVKVTVPAPAPEVPAAVPEKPITEMTAQELEVKVIELQQKLITLLSQLIQLLQGMLAR